MVEIAKPYPRPYDCTDCGRTHAHKTYHLDIDAEGFCIVSPRVFERLRNAYPPFAGMTYANSVDDPPPLRINGNRSDIERVFYTPLTGGPA